MEEIRYTKITVHVETNKSSYEEEFDDIEEAVAYLDRVRESIRGWCPEGDE